MLELARDAEVEVGGVGEDGELRATVAGGGDESAELFVYARDVVDYLNQADDRQALSADDGFDAGFAQASASAAEEAEVGVAALEFLDEEGGLAVARGFTGGDQDGGGGIHWRFQGTALAANGRE